MKEDGTPDMERDMPWSRYTLPNGCQVFLTSRPDRYVARGDSFYDLFERLTGLRPRIRLYFTDDLIRGAIPKDLGLWGWQTFEDRAVWIPWFVDADKREHDGANPTLSSIATAVTLMRTYVAELLSPVCKPNTLWLHCDSSSMRAPTFFGLYLRTFYDAAQIETILQSRVTNMPENYRWSCPKEYSQIDLDRNPQVQVLLDQIKEKYAVDVKCGPSEQEKCCDTEAGFYQCQNHYNFYHKKDK